MKELQPFLNNGKPNPCFGCGYSWHDEGDEYPSCHCTCDEDAPCHYNENGDYEPY